MMTKIIGNLSRGLAFVLSAPAGTGKTTLVKMLMTEFSCIAESISYTTRPIRAQEVEGRDYHFIGKGAFEGIKKEDGFLENVSLYEYSYGTKRADLEDSLNKGKHVFLVIDTQGALKLKDQGFEATYIFVGPPSIEELRRRLNYRQTDSASSIETRLKIAEEEISKAKFYDYHLINKDLSDTYRVLKSILICKEHEKLTNLKKEGLIPWNICQIT
ncbi:Guanylate kinase [Chlamydiales bacterium SCGC AB-751-O23]|jgi:guanylate kinase|nr:Guanylate kinase [Chlamydiales bacterium SCGC AB-751-O23]